MSSVELNGTNGNDLLDASSYTDISVLRGFDGDDTLIGGSGNDRLSGGSGNNLLLGGVGNDLLFVSPNPGDYNTVFGGAGRDTLILGVTAIQYADPAIKAALSQLDYYIANNASDPAAHFVSDVLHLDMVEVEAVKVRVEAALAPVEAVVPGPFAVLFSNTTQSYAGTDYTLASRWVVNGPAFISGETFAAVDRSWSLFGTADVNGDLKADVLWQNATDGAIAAWVMDGDTYLRGATIYVPTAGQGWKIAGTADFDGDGRSDVLVGTVLTDSAGLIYTKLQLLELMPDGVTLDAATMMPDSSAGWTVSGLGDFNGDGKSDLLWRHLDGNVAIWDMNGPTLLQAATVAQIDVAWSVAGIGDVDGDGRSDIIWRNTDGSVAIWEMDGMGVKAAATIYNPGTEWQVADIADHNGDGRADIVWRHAPIAGVATTEVQVWTMHGLTVAGVGTLGFVANEWQIV